uniref:Uncharacterized protein n=1 Tax=viral metagenome TaxID=1070528 RepID=A0A6C0E8E3_9ZZZZ
MIYNCVYCDYKTSKKNSYLAHQKSNKHRANQKKYLSKFGVVPENHTEIEDNTQSTSSNIYKSSTQKHSRSKLNKSNNRPKLIKKEYEPEIEEIDQVNLEFDLDESLLQDLNDLNDVNDVNELNKQNDVNDVNREDYGIDEEMVRLVSFSNLDDFYKTVSNSFLQQIRFFTEFGLLKLSKSQQEAYDFIKKKYCYLDQDIHSELLKDLKLSLIISNFIDDHENTFEINN